MSNKITIMLLVVTHSCDLGEVDVKPSCFYSVFYYINHHFCADIKQGDNIISVGYVGTVETLEKLVLHSEHGAGWEIISNRI